MSNTTWRPPVAVNNQETRRVVQSLQQYLTDAAMKPTGAAWGIIANSSAGGTGLGATATTIATASISVTDARKLKVSFCAAIKSSVGGESWTILVKRDGTSLGAYPAFGTPSGSVDYGTSFFYADSPPSGAHTYTAVIGRASGSGTGTVDAGTLLVEDCGPL